MKDARRGSFVSREHPARRQTRGAKRAFPGAGLEPVPINAAIPRHLAQHDQPSRSADRGTTPPPQPPGRTT
jgi:hypothetical protein